MDENIFLITEKKTQKQTKKQTNKQDFRHRKERAGRSAVWLTVKLRHLQMEQMEDVNQITFSTITPNVPFLKKTKKKNSLRMTDSK